MTTPIHHSRRSVLRTTGTALAALTTTSTLASASDLVEVNVGFDADDGRKSTLDAAAEVVREFEFPALTVRVPRAAVEGLRKRPDLTYVEENGEMHAVAQTLPWGVDRMDAEIAPCHGGGADVGIVDTGIDSTHPDLQANLGSGRAIVPCSGSTCNVAWDDDNGHGTHVAGVVGARDNNRGVVGVAPDATLHAVKVLDGQGTGTYSDVAAGIQHVGNQGWDVANLSLAGSYSSVVDSAVQWTHSQGATLVAAAGNSGPCTNCVTFPATLTECIAVTAMDRTGAFAPFSSQGPQVEFIAPGVDVYSTFAGGGYRQLTGTSVACPHVAGTAALVMSQGATNVQARNHMHANAISLGGLSGNQQGSGMVYAPAMC